MVTLPVRVEENTRMLLWNWAADSTTGELFRLMPTALPTTRSITDMLALTGVSQTPTRSPRAGSSRLMFGVKVETMGHLRAPARLSLLRVNWNLAGKARAGRHQHEERRLRR